MLLADYLVEKFRNGIQYEDAVEICLSIYCTSDIFSPGLIDGELSMDRIAQAFADISKQGLITGYSPYKSIRYGANYHSIEDKGHWIEIQASIVKLKTTYDKERVRMLMAEQEKGS